MFVSCTLALLLWQGEPAPAQEPAPTQEAAETPAPKQQEKAKRLGTEQAPRRGGRGGGRPGGDDEARRWWESLSEEERAQARERMKRLREMSPEAREELERRAKLLRSVGEQVRESMSAEERKAFDALPREERGRQHQAMVREALRERGENVDGWEMPQRGPLEDRLRRSKEQRAEWAKKRRERELKRAESEGWLSAKAVERLQQASPEQVDATLDQVRQWRTIEWLDEKGGWARMKVDDETRERLIGLEPKAFFEELRKLSGPLRREGAGRGGPRGERGEGGKRGPHGRGEGPPMPGRGDGPPPRGEGPPPDGGERPPRKRGGGGGGGWR